VLLLELAEGNTGAGVTELAGALALGAGAGEADEGEKVNEGTSLGGAGAGALLDGAGEGDDEGAWLDGAGEGAWLDGAGAEDDGADDAAGAELGLGVALVAGSGFEASFLAGTVPFLSINRAWVTSRAESCWPTPDLPSQAPVYHFEPQVLPSAPPEQDFAAPTADALRYLVTVSLVKGAMIAVLAMKRDR
jgi:hypothetical protein